MQPLLVQLLALVMALVSKVVVLCSFKRCTILGSEMDNGSNLLPSLVQERQWLHHFDPQISNNAQIVTNEATAHPDKVGLNFNIVRNGTSTTQTDYA